MFPPFSGHEYAKDNLEFAQHIDPTNDEVKVRSVLPTWYQTH